MDWGYAASVSKPMDKKLPRFPFLYFLLSILLGGLPFALYFFERISGLLTSEDSWYGTGANHGPWRWGIEGFTIYYPLLILMIVSLTKSLSGVKERNWRLLAAGFALVAAQLVLLFGQMYFLTWTID